MKLTIEMPWEKNLSVNHMRFGPGGGYRKKLEVQAWMESLAWKVRVGRINQDRHAYIALPVRVKVDFHWPNARRTDDHNYYKVIADAVADGLHINDTNIRISTGTVEIDRDNPGFTITVSDA